MKLKVLAMAAVLSGVSFQAHADFLEKLNNVIDKVDDTLTMGERTTDRFDQTQQRINDKIPEREEPIERTPEAPSGVEPAAGGQETLSPSEQEAILEQARRIEEDRVLKEAERIRQRRNSYGR